MDETVVETEVVDETAVTTTEEETAPLTVEEMEKLLKEYTNNKSIVEVPVSSDGKANVEVVHTVTLGDIYIIALLTILVITTLLTRLFGRR